MMIGARFLYSIVLIPLISLLLGCEGDNTGGVAQLSWNAVVAQPQVSYTVHYGKQSSGRGGSCDYENSVDVAEPAALLTGLELDTQYYFAVSAFNEGGRSMCSSEVSKRTTPLSVEPMEEPSPALRRRPTSDTF